MTDKRKELLQACMQNEVDYWNLPQYAMIPDWFVRYWDLHNMVLEYFGEEPYPEPLDNFRKHLTQEEP